MIKHLLLCRLILEKPELIILHSGFASGFVSKLLDLYSGFRFHKILIRNRRGTLDLIGNGGKRCDGAQSPKKKKSEIEDENMFLVVLILLENLY